MFGKDDAGAPSLRCFRPFPSVVNDCLSHFHPDQSLPLGGLSLFPPAPFFTIGALSLLYLLFSTGWNHIFSPYAKKTLFEKMLRSCSSRPSLRGSPSEALPWIASLRSHLLKPPNNILSSLPRVTDTFGWEALGGSRCRPSLLSAPKLWRCVNLSGLQFVVKNALSLAMMVPGLFTQFSGCTGRSTW